MYIDISPTHPILPGRYCTFSGQVLLPLHNIRLLRESPLKFPFVSLFKQVYQLNEFAQSVVVISYINSKELFLA